MLALARLIDIQRQRLATLQRRVEQAEHFGSVQRLSVVRRQRSQGVDAPPTTGMQQPVGMGRMTQRGPCLTQRDLVTIFHPGILLWVSGVVIRLMNTY